MPQLRFERVHGPSGSAAGLMSRLRRFPDNRFIGRRDKMIVYDCDDPEEFAVLENAVIERSLDARNQLQSFALDNPTEARNRGFRPPDLSS